MQMKRQAFARCSLSNLIYGRYQTALCATADSLHYALPCRENKENKHKEHISEGVGYALPCIMMNTKTQRNEWAISSYRTIMAIKSKAAISLILYSIAALFFILYFRPI